MRKTCWAFALSCLVWGASSVSAQRPGLTVQQVDTWMAELSNWGRWGTDDQRGTINLMTPAVRKQALTLAREGVSVSLAHTIEKDAAADNPRPLGQQMRPVLPDSTPRSCRGSSNATSRCLATTP